MLLIRIFLPHNLFEKMSGKLLLHKVKLLYVSQRQRKKHDKKSINIKRKKK